ncbi:MAG: hypothetical protein AB1631_09530 [Acidobacteriota bacterium]
MRLSEKENLCAASAVKQTLIANLLDLSFTISSLPYSQPTEKLTVVVDANQKLAAYHAEQRRIITSG